MNQIKMQVLTARTLPINRWDKDSIRPGPVGSVGDVNLQVKLKKSSPDMPERYEAAFSKKNEVWSGSNVSDGQWTGYTSGGRGAITLRQPMQFRESFKTPVGWVFENVLPVDRTREAKMVPLGQYSWESEKAKIYKAKITGDQFLPLPNGYTSTEQPRGSHFARIVASSIGEGTALPAAEVKITDPIFGDNGVLVDEITIPESGIPGSGCNPEIVKQNKDSYWVPRIGDKAARRVPPPEDYPYRAAYNPLGKGWTTNWAWWPEVGTPEYIGIPGRVFGWRVVENTEKVTFHPCGGIRAAENYDNPTETDGGRSRRNGRRPRPGNNPIGRSQENEPIGRKKIKV